jgi:creatinine amidohydrolase/Fe(II)-dependent formamide hydrolase-like protein
MKVIYWKEITSHEVTEIFVNLSHQPALIVFPLGVVEAHGPLMPNGFDTMLARLFTHIVCERVASMLENKNASFIIYDSLSDFGVISSTYELDGGILHSGELISELMFVTIRGMYKKGLKHFFVLNGDGGTGKSLRALLFRNKTEWTEFFGNWDGTLFFVSWFDGTDVHIEHAGTWEHAVLKYVCDHADDYTRQLAAHFRLSAHRLTDENLHSLESFLPKKYPYPLTEIISWKQIPGQEESGGVTSFSLEMFQDIITSGKVEQLWHAQVAKVTMLLHDRIKNLL